MQLQLQRRRRRQGRREDGSRPPNPQIPTQISRSMKQTNLQKSERCTTSQQIAATTRKSQAKTSDNLHLSAPPTACSWWRTSATQKTTNTMQNPSKHNTETRCTTNLGHESETKKNEFPGTQPTAADESLGRAPGERRSPTTGRGSQAAAAAESPRACRVEDRRRRRGAK